MGEGRANLNLEAQQEHVSGSEYRTGECEVLLMCDKLGLDAWEVIEVAAVCKPDGVELSF